MICVETKRVEQSCFADMEGLVDYLEGLDDGYIKASRGAGGVQPIIFSIDTRKYDHVISGEMAYSLLQSVLLYSEVLLKLDAACVSAVERDTGFVYLVIFDKHNGYIDLKEALALSYHADKRAVKIKPEFFKLKVDKFHRVEVVNDYFVY